ncbi:uncharacterized protein LOC132291428 isoform X5 [Cornus florida]|uniref:uncharacterized protein LOC132291428 isoform X5 n=1 Tax=Cornus florida TaxID=4283 RepID=UPI0028A1156C|nr:uncharacterized protein LOC132291428 isoform X5 [Cornus florida]
MDCTLWDSSWDQDMIEESSYYMGQGWQCDFYFGYGHDMIEENALNEKLCVQVLRMLITKADSEINELEEDLVILQNQLAWADEEWSKICCATLTEKIDCLVTSIQSLKNENGQDMDDFGVALPMHREPAERVHEIVKALLRNYFQQKDEQPAKTILQNSHSDIEKLVIDHSCKEQNLRNPDLKISGEEAIERSSGAADPIVDLLLKHEEECTDVAEKDKQEDIIIGDSSSDALEHAIDNSSNKIELSEFDSKVNRKEGGKCNKSTTMGRSKISSSSFKSARKGTNLPETQEDIIIKDSSSDALEHAFDHSSEKIELSKFDSKVNRKEGDQNNKSTTMGRSKISSSSFKSARKGTNLPETQEDIIIKDSSSDALEHAFDHSSEKIELSKFDSKVNRKEGDQNNKSTTMGRSKISDLSLKSARKGRSLPETEDTIIKDSSSDALEHAVDNFSEKIESSKLDSKVNGKEGGQNNKSTTMGRSKISNLSLNSARKGTNLPETLGNAILKDSNSDASRLATGSKGKDKLSKTDLEVIVKKEIIEMYSVEKRTILKSSLKPGIERTNISETIEPAGAILSSKSDASEAVTEDSKPKLSGGHGATQTDKMNSFNLSSKREKIIKSPSRVKGQDDFSEDTFEDSLRVVLCRIRGDTIRTQSKTKRRPKPRQVQNAELAATGKSNSNSSLNPQRQRVKRELELIPVRVLESGFSSVEVHSDASSIKSKRQLGFGMADDQISSNQSASMGTNKKAQSGMCCTEEKHGVTADVGTEVPLSNYKRKKSSNSADHNKTKKLRGLQINSEQLHTPDSATGKDLWITDCSFTKDSDKDTVKLLPCPELPYPDVVALKNLSLVDLKAIAKQRGMKGYSKLRKAVLTVKLLPCPELPYPDVVAFKNLSLVDLKAIAKQRGMKGYSKLRKAVLANRLGLNMEGRGGNEGKKELLPSPLMIEGVPESEK